MPTTLKHQISSPLEAGTSLLDAYHLPPQLSHALEFSSKRLAAKGLHISLAVVRRDYHLPGYTTEAPEISPPARSPPTTRLPPTPNSAVSSTSSSRSGFTSPLGAIRRLVRPRTMTESTATKRLSSSLQHQQQQRTARTMTPMFDTSSISEGSVASISSNSPRLNWPLSPMSNPSSMPLTPMTPFTPATPALTVESSVASSVADTEMTGNRLSSTAATTTTISGSGKGWKLVYASPHNAKMDKIVRATFIRAADRHRIGREWLPAPLSPQSCAFGPHLIHRSIVQNEVLFASEGLTLLALDHLYTFKSALASYASTGCGFKLEDALDELRRYVLCNGRRRLKKSVLLESYTWLEGDVSQSALGDVSRMYRRAYGGAEKECGVENDVDGWNLVPPPTPPPIELSMEDSVPASAIECWRRFERDGVAPFFGRRTKEDDEREEAAAIAAAATAAVERPVVTTTTTTTTETETIAEDVEAEAEDDFKTPTEASKVQSLEAALATLEAAPKAMEMIQKPLPLLPSTSPLPFRAADQHNKLPVIRTPVLHRSRASPSPILPALKIPALKLQTNFIIKPTPQRIATPVRDTREEIVPSASSELPKMVPSATITTTDDKNDAEAIKIELDVENPVLETGDITARPIAGPAFWINGASTIDEILNNENHKNPIARLSAQTQRHGPNTPNGYDDISPITRGEWGFLQASGTFAARTAAVETC